MLREPVIDDSLRSLNRNSLSAPVPPDGFETQIVFDKSHPLNAYNLWVSTLAVLYDISSRGWDTSLGAKNYIMTISSSDITVKVSADAPIRIEFGHVVLAFYNAVNAMFQLQPGFFECNTTFRLR